MTNSKPRAALIEPASTPSPMISLSTRNSAVDRRRAVMVPFNTTELDVNYRVIYLQRLANPLLPYDAADNPYRNGRPDGR